MASIFRACALILLARPTRAAVLAGPAAGQLLSAGGGEAARYRNPHVWGPPTWFFLHSVTLALPENVPPIMQAGMKSLVVGMHQVLPCKACRDHLAQHLWLHPVEASMATREGAVRWMIDLHNVVNEGLGKQVLSHKEVLQSYAAAYSGQATTYSDPRVWGPAAWFFLHSVTLALPEDAVPPDMQVGLRQLFYGMWQVLPCSPCQRLLEERLGATPVELNAARREGAIQWMIDFHNEVNRELGKRVLLREEVLQAYDKAFSSPSERRKVFKELLKPRPSRFLKILAVLGFLGAAAGTGVFWLQLKKQQGHGNGVYDIFAWRRCFSARRADEDSA